MSSDIIHDIINSINPTFPVVNITIYCNDTYDKWFINYAQSEYCKGKYNTMIYCNGHIYDEINARVSKCNYNSVITLRDNIMCKHFQTTGFCIMFECQRKNLIKARNYADAEALYKTLINYSSYVKGANVVINYNGKIVIENVKDSLITNACVTVFSVMLDQMGKGKYDALDKNNSMTIKKYGYHKLLIHV